MKVIIDCDQAHYPAAAGLLERELPSWRDRFTKIGWGWSETRNGARFFIRRITDGLSINQVEPERVGNPIPQQRTAHG